MLYVETFRRIPFLVILFIVLFVIEPLVPGSSLFAIATVSVCLLSTAFLSEVVRAGLRIGTCAADRGRAHAQLQFRADRSSW